MLKPQKYAIFIFMIKIKNKNANIIIKKIRTLKENHQAFTAKIIDLIAYIIRKDVLGYKDTDDATPINAAATEFGLSVYHLQNSEIKTGLYIDHMYNRRRKKTKAIYVNSQLNLYEQRFIIAYMLGRYLFDYIGSNYEAKHLSYKFHYDHHDRIARYFAISLLMPKSMFIAEHNYAVDLNDDHDFIIKYLSKVFQANERLVEQRIRDIQNQK